MTFGTNTPSSLRINSGSTHIKKKKKKGETKYRHTETRVQKEVSPGEGSLLFISQC